jgi:hypothetical protein
VAILIVSIRKKTHRGGAEYLARHSRNRVGSP